MYVKKLNKKYRGWDSEEHLDVFNLWNTFPDYEFKFKWGCFLENFNEKSILIMTRIYAYLKPLSNIIFWNGN